MDGYAAQLLLQRVDDGLIGNALIISLVHVLSLRLTRPFVCAITSVRVGVCSRLLGRLQLAVWRFGAGFVGRRSRLTRLSRIGSKQRSLIYINKVRARNGKAATGKVLHTSIEHLAADGLRHTALSQLQRLAAAHAEHQAQPLAAGRDVSQADAQLLLAPSHLLEVELARSQLQMIQVEDAKTAGNSTLVRAVTVAEGGVEAEHGQAALQLALAAFELLSRDFSSLPSCAYLNDICAYAGGGHVVEDTAEILWRAGCHAVRVHDVGGKAPWKIHNFRHFFIVVEKVAALMINDNPPFSGHEFPIYRG